MMLPAIIDYPTLEKWRNRQAGTLHGEIMANLDNLISMAIRYDNAVVVTRDQKKKIAALEQEVELLRLQLEEAKLSACSTWQCGGRK